MTTLPTTLTAAFNRVVSDWDREGKVGRLWAGDSSLWTGGDENQWLGWLSIADMQLSNLNGLATIAPNQLGGAFDDVLVLGMGGAALCSEVLSLSFDDAVKVPRIHLLDSTDPLQIRMCEQRLSLDRTLFIVSSKSGTTIESNSLMLYFLERISAVITSGTVGERFVAVTDPGSELELFAETHCFRQIFYGVPSIGGRYSALSHFGMVPASAMGLDVEELLERAKSMMSLCSKVSPIRENPGAMLGLMLGVAAKEGRDKLTFVASPSLRAFGTWVEQLIAESTGKGGLGLIPVDGEVLAEPSAYGQDRIFVYMRDGGTPDSGQDSALSKLRKAGHPVLRIGVRDRYDLGGEFFRWEFATAVVGAVLKINPFDQPEVEASKVETGSLISVYEKAGALPNEEALVDDLELGLAVFADTQNVAELGVKVRAGETKVSDIIVAHCARLGPGDYLAVLAYVEMNTSHEFILQELRHVVRNATGNATCIGFGPRFLHSTGQAYKGGPNSGLFLQITCDDIDDINVPGYSYTFGLVKAAQARGDLKVLSARGRRVIRLHIRGNVREGLQRITAVVKQTLERQV